MSIKNNPIRMWGEEKKNWEVARLCKENLETAMRTPLSPWVRPGSPRGRPVPTFLQNEGMLTRAILGRHSSLPEVVLTQQSKGGPVLERTVPQEEKIYRLLAGRDRTMGGPGMGA